MWWPGAKESQEMLHSLLSFVAHQVWEKGLSLANWWKTSQTSLDSQSVTPHEVQGRRSKMECIIISQHAILWKRRSGRENFWSQQMSMEICMEQAGQLLMLLPTLERSESHLFSLICFSVVVWDHFHEQLADCDRSQLFPSDHEKSGSQRILLKCFWMSPGWKSRTVEFHVLLSFFQVIRKSHAVTWNIPYM